MKHLLGTAMIGICLLGGAHTVSAQNPSPSPMDYSAATRWTAQNWAWWNSLTPRQQALERAISLIQEKYRQNTGNYYVPLTNENVQAVMRAIGARPGEAAFVRERMQDYVTIGEGQRRVDEFLRHAQQNPQWYLPPQMRSRP